MFRRPGRPSVTIEESRTAVLDGREVRYILRRSAKARRVRLEVRADTGLVVVVPASFPLSNVPAILEQKKGWVLGKLAARRERSAARAPKPLADGDPLPFFGRQLTLLLLHDPARQPSIRFLDDRLMVNLPAAADGALPRLLEAWYRVQAGWYISRRAVELAAPMGVTYSRITIRGQKTRWGSCSRKGNLSFNWRLALAPPAVVDYVIIHEMAHRLHMDHSRQFWQAVARHCPGWQAHRRWLKEHEAELYTALIPASAS